MAEGCPSAPSACTYVVAVLAVQVVRLGEVDVRVGDDAGVVQVVLPARVRQQPVGDEDVASLCDHGRVLGGGARDARVRSLFVGRVEALGVVVEVLADT